MVQVDLVLCMKLMHLVLVVLVLVVRPLVLRVVQPFVRLLHRMFVLVPLMVPCSNLCVVRMLPFIVSLLN
jgi:hypothetical protein